MKQYQGEKAIISLTSWKARINTVGLTIFSLIKQCPGFHIVLVLSEEEFPKKEAELPRDLNLLADTNKIEILWVYKNYKSFKKVLFTMDKYRDVPVISADDDCIYTCNYAEKLYSKWVENKNAIITFHASIVHNITFPHGPSTLYPNYKFCQYGLINLKNEIIKTNHDDGYYGIIANKLKISVYSISKKVPYIFHNTNNALSNGNTYTIKKMLKLASIKKLT